MVTMEIKNFTGKNIAQDQKFIDTHVHLCFNTPIFKRIASQNKITFSLDALEMEMDKNGIEKAVAIGIDMVSNRLISEIARKSERFIPVFGINLENKSNFRFYFDNAKKMLRDGKISGLKIYLGYDHFYANSRVWEPLYRLAAEYRVPVVFHTGDTWDAMRKKEFIKYSQPLAIDEVAVNHPDVKFLLAHAGNPWIDEAAEILFKNPNCYADISGWFFEERNPALLSLMRRKLVDLVTVGGSNKVLFGTDWPLVSFHSYIRLVAGLFKPAILKKIAYSNAKSFWSAND